MSSNVVDLTNSDDNDNFDEEPAHPAKRIRTGAGGVVIVPSKVFIIIHDKEPQDSGSDHVYSAALPMREDTKIVGVYYEYADAARAAKDYVANEFGVNYDDENEFNAPLGEIDWREQGWFRQEMESSNDNDDRVHIQEHAVS